MAARAPDAVPEGNVREVAGLFLKLGTVAFGGPAAHIAMMHRECVEQRKWLSEQEFADLLGACNLIPGPNSTELAFHIGLKRAGWKGLLAALLFILPAVLIVSAIAWGYVRYGTLPAVQGILVGIKPVLIAIILHAVWKLRRAVAKDAWTLAALVAAVGLHLLGVNELIVLFGAALAVTLPRLGPAPAKPMALAWPVLAVPVMTGLELTVLFLVFLKIGAVLYGSGYVLLAFLEGDLVERLGWLTQAQLLDAVSIGQVTPGPVFTTATFIGYVVGGWPGAVVATIGIFLPGFVFVAATHRWIARLRDRPATAAFLDGINAAAVGLMLSVTWTLGQTALIDARTWALAAVALALLVRTRINPTWLIAAGAVVGLL